MISLRKWIGDLPGDPAVKTSPSNVGDLNLIRGQGAKIPHDLQPKKQDIKQKQYCNKFNKDFKNDTHAKKGGRVYKGNTVEQRQFV